MGTFTKKAAIQTGSNRSFGLLFGLIFTGYALFPLLHGGSIRFLALLGGLLFLFFALVLPHALSSLNYGWMYFGYLLSKIMNPLIMGVLFFGVLVPTAIALRLVGKEVLALRLDKTKKSYWMERLPPGPDGGQMKNQF